MSGTSVYFVEELGPDDEVLHIKIGHCTQFRESYRLSTLQTGNPRKLKMRFHAVGTEREEQWLHYFFRIARVEQSEWFHRHASLVQFIEHCEAKRTLDLVHLSPCTWKIKEGQRTRILPSCQGCDTCRAS